MHTAVCVQQYASVACGATYGLYGMETVVGGALFAHAKVLLKTENSELKWACLNETLKSQIEECPAAMVEEDQENTGMVQQCSPSSVTAVRRR